MEKGSGLTYREAFVCYALKQAEACLLTGNRLASKCGIPFEIDEVAWLAVKRTPAASTTIIVQAGPIQPSKLLGVLPMGVECRTEYGSGHCIFVLP